jgi:hypothetical protein
MLRRSESATICSMPRSPSIENRETARRRCACPPSPRRRHDIPSVAARSMPRLTTEFTQSATVDSIHESTSCLVERTWPRFFAVAYPESPITPKPFSTDSGFGSWFAPTATIRTPSAGLQMRRRPCHSPRTGPPTSQYNREHLVHQRPDCCYTVPQTSRSRQKHGVLRVP